MHRRIEESLDRGSASCLDELLVRRTDHRGLLAEYAQDASFRHDRGEPLGEFPAVVAARERMTGEALEREYGH